MPSHEQLDSIFPGDSEMASRMRVFDWSRTDLGPVERWPEHLRAAVRLCLTSPFPILLWWGPTLALLYNDAYVPWLSEAKHPQALGRPGYECWGEVWDTIAPMLDSVISAGQATWSVDVELFYERKVRKEEVYITWSFAPILAADGRTVDGVFCPCFETTEKVIGARRLETLRKLGSSPEEARTVSAACQDAVAVLGENTRDIPFAAIYTVDPSGDRFTLSAAALPPGEHGLPATFSPSDDDSRSPWPLATTLRTRRAHDCVDLPARGVRLSSGPWPESVQNAVAIPIRGAHDKLLGIVVLGASTRQPLGDAYRTFFDLVAARVAIAISRAEAYTAEWQRAEALAELDRAKTAFFSHVSHEFRTPLTLLLGPLRETLVATSLPAEYRERLVMAHRNAQRLLKLVNSLLNFSRIEAGRAQAVYGPCDLGALTGEIVSTFRSMIEHAGLRFRVDCPSSPEPVYVDRDMWEKIVLNLVSNAFKFTFKGEIAVTLTAHGDQVVLTVADTGSGIPAEQLPHVFERFHRVPGAPSRSYEGTGIGLALVHELARLHGGMVAVASEVDRGTTFTVTIPRGSAHLPADRISATRTQGSTATGAAAYVDEAAGWLPDGIDLGTDLPVGAEPTARGARIVLAEDNNDMREYLRQLLGRTYEVHTAADGEAALAAVRANPPDLVVADVMMPGLDGFGLLRALRADARTRVLPVILLSARAGEEAYVEGLSAGATDYLVKPFAGQELLARVSARLEIARLNREAIERHAQTRKAILDGMADRYYAVDGAWRYTEFNAQAEAQLQALGKDPAALIGKVLWDEFPDPPPENALREAMHERRPTTHEHYYEPLQEWVENHIYPTDDGGLAIFQRYVTESKRLEEQLRRTAAYLADAEALSHMGTWAWNPFTHELFWSAEHFRIFGLEPDSVKPTYELALGGVHPEDRPLLEAAFAGAVAQHRQYRFDCRVVRPDGGMRYVRSLARPVFSQTGQLVEYVGTTIDMTERVHADEALRRSQQELAHVTRVLNLSALTASIGHDLSQFVAAIETNSSACLRWLSREQPNVEEAAAAVRRIMRDAGLVAEVIGNIRGVLQKTAGTKADVDVAGVVRETRLLVEAEAASQRVVIEESIGEGLPPVLAVRVELQQVLLNLMLNAVEAMAEVAERPRILRIHCALGNVEHAPAVVVGIEDSGPGFATVDPERLFDAFYTTKPQGLGMGLLIARSIVEAHGGRLWPMPNTEHGVTFHFTIPLARRP